MNGVNDPHNRHHHHQIQSDCTAETDISVIADTAAAAGSGSSFRMKHLLDEQKRSDNYVMGCGGRDGHAIGRGALAVGCSDDRDEALPMSLRRTVSASVAASAIGDLTCIS